MIFKDAHAKRQKEIRDLMKKRREKAVLVDRISRLESQINTHLKLYLDTKDNIYIDMQAGINLEVLRKCAISTISVVRMAFYPLDCC